MNARMTIHGIEEHLNYYDKSFADSFILENETYDKDTFVNMVILRAGTFEPLYTDPEFFRSMCGIWWKSYQRTFEKWFTVFDKEYEPLWDRDGHETVHEDTYDVGTNDVITKNKEVIDDDTTGHVENKVSAFDSSTYQPHDESNSSGTDDRTTDFDGNMDADSTNDRDFDREYHSWGNWGISMTAQKLLESELEVQKFNIYNHMVDLFCKDLLITVF